MCNCVGGAQVAVANGVIILLIYAEKYKDGAKYFQIVANALLHNVKGASCSAGGLIYCEILYPLQNVQMV